MLVELVVVAWHVVLVVVGSGAVVDVDDVLLDEEVDVDELVDEDVEVEVKEVLVVDVDDEEVVVVGGTVVVVVGGRVVDELVDDDVVVYEVLLVDVDDVLDVVGRYVVVVVVDGRVVDVDDVEDVEVLVVDWYVVLVVCAQSPSSQSSFSPSCQFPWLDALPPARTDAGAPPRRMTSAATVATT